MLTLHAGDVRLAIAPQAGGRLASLVVGERELLVGPPGPDDRSIWWGCFLMAPWAGRLAGGRLPWRGSTIRLPRTHGRHAIHGLVWNREWAVEDAGPDRASLACDLPADWPMGGVVRQSVRLSSEWLELDATITATEAMPAALGWHPWFARGGGPISVRVDAAEVLETDRMVPTGRTLAVTGDQDLRDGPILGSRRLDLAYVGARSPARIAWPDLALSISFEPSPATVVVYTPAHAVCVEPQTAPPNALGLPEAGARAVGVRMLGPGETLGARLRFAWAASPTMAR